MIIRLAIEEDWNGIWPIVHEVLQSGDTYAWPPDTSRDEAFYLWMTGPAATFAAEEDGEILGTCYLKPNQPGQGSHVCNAGFMVSAEARGRGLGRALGVHALNEAHRMGFSAMQFNFVASTNTAAVRLWRDLGFAVVGTLPGAFRHPVHGDVDAYVMYQTLK